MAFRRGLARWPRGENACRPVRSLKSLHVLCSHWLIKITRQIFTRIITFFYMEIFLHIKMYFSFDILFRNTNFTLLFNASPWCMYAVVTDIRVLTVRWRIKGRHLNGRLDIRPIRTQDQHTINKADQENIHSRWISYYSKLTEWIRNGWERPLRENKMSPTSNNEI